MPVFKKPGITSDDVLYRTIERIAILCRDEGTIHMTNLEVQNDNTTLGLFCRQAQPF